MKYRLLDWLVCPHCRNSELGLQAATVDLSRRETEVMDGLLTCASCGTVYPIVRGIPRMLPDSLLEHHDYLSALRLRNLPKPNKTEAEIWAFRRLHRSTQLRFGFEWLRYEVTDPAEDFETFRETTGFVPEELAGKRILDAGCGMGRYMRIAARHGAEVVGIDLSASVERARRETSFSNQSHLVQGDILNPPLRPDVFDSVYSIGVLHHTPDPPRAFGALCPLLRPGGRISIWVYPKFQPEVPVAFHKRAFAFLGQVASDGTRAVTTRMPRLLLHYLCYTAVPLGWLKNRAFQSSRRRKLFWPLLLLPISGHEKWQVRLCDTFDWLAPRFQWKYKTTDILDWFQAEGLTGMSPLKRSVSATGVRMGGKEGTLAAPRDRLEGRSYAFRQD